MREYSLTETAGLVRQALKAAFPKTKFSVRSKRYAGGCSISVHWADGPREKQVNGILAPFEGCGFDGMTDCKTYNPNSIFKGEEADFGADYVQGQRSISFERMKEAAFYLAFECDLPLLKITRSDYDGSGYVAHGEGGGMVPWSIYRDYDTGEPTLCSNQGNGEWYEQLVHSWAHSQSWEATGKVDLPEPLTQPMIDAVVERMAIQ